MSAGIRPEIMRAHRGTWFVYAGGEKIPHQATMRGLWGYDVECSCGQYASKTGGGLRRYVEELLWDHRWSVQCEKDREKESN